MLEHKRVAGWIRSNHSAIVVGSKSPPGPPMHVLTVCRLCGTFPLMKRNFELSVPWFLYSWALVTANAVVQAACILYNSYENYTPFFAYMSTTQRAIRIICPPACLFFVARNRKMLAKHVRILNSVDPVFRKFGANPEEPYKTKFVKWCLPAFILCSIFEACRRNDEDPIEFVKNMTEQALTMVAMTSAIMQFVYFVDKVITKLKTLNESLDTLVGFTKFNKVSANSDTLLLMSDAHYLISVSTELLSDAYAPVYFAMVSGLVGMLIVNVYKDAAYLGAGWYLSTVEQLCWTGYWLSCVGAIVFPAAKASRMSSDFNIQLSQLIVDGYSSSIFSTEESIAHNKLRVHVDFNYVVKFSCGFFDLDRFLIHSILGGICSFSVILVQISAQEDGTTEAVTLPANSSEQPASGTEVAKSN